MKGFPRRGSNSGLLEGWVVARIAASMKGFPRRGSNKRASVGTSSALEASMKGFPRRGSNSGLEKSLLVK